MTEIPAMMLEVGEELGFTHETIQHYFDILCDHFGDPVSLSLEDIRNELLCYKLTDIMIQKMEELGIDPASIVISNHTISTPDGDSIMSIDMDFSPVSLPKGK